MTTIDGNMTGGAIPTMTDPMTTTTDGAGQTATVKAMAEVAAILAGAALKVSGANGVANGKGVTLDVGIPELEDADEAMAFKADMEELLALLTMEQTEEQLQATKKRLEQYKTRYKEQTDATMKRLEKAYDDAVKAEKAAKAKRALGWLGVVFSFVAAVVTTVVSGGTLAVAAWAGFGLSLATQIMSETGADQKICKAIADSLKKTFPGMSQSKADMWAGIIFGVTMAVAGLACGVAGLKATAGQGLIHASQAAMKIVNVAQKTTTLALTAVSLTASGVATGFNYNAGLSQADATEIQKLLVELNRRMEEGEEELEHLLQLLNDSVGQVAHLIESKEAANAEIIEQTKTMS